MKFARQWGPIIVLALVVLAGAVYINHLRNKGSSAAEARDRLALELAGANAVAEVSAKSLREEAKRLVAVNTGLLAEIDRIKGAMPGSTVVGTASGSTGAIPVIVPPASPVVPGAPPSPAACPPCLLAPGDALDLRMAAVALQGDSGAVAVAGTVQAWKAGTPPVLLAEGPLKLEVKMKDPGQLPGWGAGAMVTGGRGGWGVGPVVSPPPIRVWGLEGSLLVGLALGSGGEWNAAGLGLLRW